MGSIWKTRKISWKTEVRLFNSNVKTILLYGAETWKITKSLLHKLQVFINMSQAHPQHQMAWEDFQQRALAKDQPSSSWGRIEKEKMGGG